MIGMCQSAGTHQLDLHNMPVDESDVELLVSGLPSLHVLNLSGKGSAPRTSVRHYSSSVSFMMTL